MHVTEEQLQKIATQLQTSEAILVELQRVVHKHRWQEMGACIQQYESSIGQLQTSMKHVHTIPQHMLSHFQHLSTQQRRIMRHIHQHMMQTTDDIQSLEQGLTKLQTFSSHHAEIAAQ